MNVAQLIDYLSVLVLLGFLVALLYLVILLYHANHIVRKLDHLGETMKQFVGDVVPAIVNIGTLATAMEAIIRYLHHEKENSKQKSLADNTEKKGK